MGKLRTKWIQKDIGEAIEVLNESTQSISTDSDVEM